MTKFLERLKRPRGRLPAESPENMGDEIAGRAPVSIEAAAGDQSDRPVEFESVAYTGGPLEVSGFRYPVVIDLAGLRAASQTMPALRDHEVSRIVGHTTEVAIGEDVRVRGVISGAGSDAQEVLSTARSGFPWQASHGTHPDRRAAEHLPAGKKAIVNGREVTGPATIIRRATMREFSFTPLGADSNTKTRIAASATERGEQTMTFAKWCEEQGVVADDLPEAVREKLEASWKAESPIDQSAGRSNETRNDDAFQASQASNGTIHDAVVQAANLAARETIAACRQEMEREQALAKACNGHPDILAKAQSEGWSIEKAELEVIRASRPKPLFAAGQTEGAPNPAEVIEAALAVNSGVADSEFIKAHFSENAAEQALSPRLRGFGLHALMYEVIRASGRSVTPGLVGDSLIREAFEASREIRAAGISNVDLGSTLANVTNKFIVAGFNSVERVWEAISSTASHRDFKPTSGVRLTGDFTYEQIGADGQLKHAEMGDEAYTNQIDTYGKIFSIPRKTLINDDLNFIRDTAMQRIGRGAGLAINRVFWTEFLDNATFFTAGRGNFFDGATSALSIDALTEGEELFLNQTDENGDPVNLMPMILLVPNALSVPAANLMQSTQVDVTTTANTPLPNTNPHAGKFRVERSWYLSNGNISGNSAAAWYLLADPNLLGVGVIQMAFLNGRREPVIESSELDFNQLGIQMRGFHDFGVAKQEYRAGVKSKGEA